MCLYFTNLSLTSTHTSPELLSSLINFPHYPITFHMHKTYYKLSKWHIVTSTRRAGLAIIPTNLLPRYSSHNVDQYDPTIFYLSRSTRS